MALNFIEDLSITGNVSLPDSSNLKLGTGEDLRIQHDGTDSLIDNYTGHLYIRQQADDKDIIFQNDDGSGGVTEYFRVDGGAEAIIVKKTLRAIDDVRIDVGSATDGRFYHDGTDTYLTTITGDLVIKNSNDDGDIKFQSDNGSGGVTNYIKIDGAQEYTQFDKPARMMDNIYLQFGNSNDSDIYHNGTDMFMRNYADDGDIRFYCDDGSGGVEEYFRIDGQYEVNRFLKNARFNDSVKANFGTGDDLQIYHDATDSIIKNTVGHLYISNSADDKDIIFQNDDGSGGLETYFFLDGSIGKTKFPDSKQLVFGDSSDLRIHHTGGDSFINSDGVGHLYIQQFNDDKDIIFKSDDQSGGVATYITIDGSTGLTQFDKDTKHSDTIKATFGAGADGQIYSSSDNLYIDQTTADKDIILRADAGDGSTATYMTFDGSQTNIHTEVDFRIYDSKKLQLGNGADFEAFHDGSHMYMQNNTGDWYITQAADDEDIIFRGDDGSGGAATYFYMDGSLVNGSSVLGATRFPDKSKIYMGTGGDLEIFHDGTNTYLENYTGDFIFTQAADDKDIQFKSDDGSGGTTLYYYLDGSKVINRFPKNVYLEDDVKLQFGDPSTPDLVLYHDSTGGNSYINDEGTGNLLFQSGGSTRFSIGGDVAVIGSTDFAIPQGRKLLLDGVGGHTYIEEESDGNLKFYVSGNQELLLTDSLAQFENQVWIPEQIYHIGDSNTYFGFHNNDEWRVVAGGTEILEVSSSGIKLTSSGSTVNTILDEDNMASDSATALATQQSIKAYVDNKVTGVLTYQGTWNANTNTPTLSSGSGTPGYYYIVSVAGSTDLDGITDWAAGDWAVFSDLATDAWQKIDNTAVGNVSGSGANNRLVLWSGTTTVDSDSSFYMSGTTLYAPNLNLDGTLTSTSAFTIDAAGQLNLDSGNSEIHLKGSGTTFGKLFVSGSDFYINNPNDNEDIIFSGLDDSSSVTALTLDMSDAGFATFNSGITAGAGVYIPDYIYHTGDTNTYFGFYTSDTIVFRVAGTEAVRIDANGDVGIGTTDPLKKLHIVGPDGVSGSTSGNSDTALLIDNDGSNGAIIELMASNDSKGSIFFTDEDASNRGAITYGHTSDELIFKTAATTAVTIDSSQNTTFAGTIDSGNINISDGTPVLTLTDTSSSATTTITVDGVNTTIDSNGTDGDIIFKGQDSTSEITALTLDMSNAGSATFNDDIDYGGKLTQTGTTANTFAGDVVLDDGSGNSPNLKFVNGSDDDFEYYINSSGKLILEQSNTQRAEWSSGGLELANNLLIPSGYVGRDSHNRIDFQTDDVIHYRVGDSYWFRMDTTGFRPYTDSSMDLGGASYYWKDAYIDTITTTGNVSVGGTLTVASTGTFLGNGAAALKWGNASAIGTLTYDGTPNPIIRAESGKSLIFDTNGATTALTLGSDQSATFAGSLSAGACSFGTLNITDDIYHVGDTNTYFGFGDGADTFQIVTAGTDALTIDSSQAITLGGDLLIPRYLYHAGDTNTYLEFSAADNIKLYAGGKIYLHAHDNGNLILSSDNSTALTLDTSQNATFAGTLTIPSYIYHTSDPSDDTYFGFSGNDTFVVYTAGGNGLNIDSNRDVTITGELYGPNGTKAIPTYSFTNDTDTGMYLEGTGNMAFTAGGSATLTLESTAVTAKTNIVLDAADIQLDTAVSASTSSGTIIKFGSTVSMSAGQVVYGSNSMGSLVWAGTDADTGTKNILGLALGTSPTSDGILLNGIYHSASHGFTVGLPLYISTTGGEMTTTAPSGSGDYVRVVGYAIDANHIYFCPDNTWIEIS